MVRVQKIFAVEREVGIWCENWCVICTDNDNILIHDHEMKELFRRHAELLKREEAQKDGAIT